jgi:hypothetical protein
MWDPYIKATRDGLPDGEHRIVFDRFHIMRDITEAVDMVRKQEHRALLRETGASILTGTKYLWLYAATTCRRRGAPPLPPCGGQSESRPRVGDQGSVAHAVDHHRDLCPLRRLGSLPTLKPEESTFKMFSVLPPLLRCSVV